MPNEPIPSPSPRTKKKEKVQFILFAAWFSSCTLSIWVISIFLVSRTTFPADFGDLASLLFGAASVAMFLLSFFIGVLAIFGWQSLRDSVKERADAAVAKAFRKASLEVTARHYTGLGFMIGELSHELTGLKATNEDRLQYSVELCQTAYNLARSLSPDDLISLEEKDLLLTQNNLVFYSSIRGKKSDADFILKLARDLRQKSDRTDFFLTYCRAVVTYSTDQKERDDAKIILEELVNSDVPQSQKKEARLYLASLP